MWDDPIVAEVRAIRERLAEQVQFNVHAMFADLRKRQAGLGSRLVCRERARETKQAVPLDRDSTTLHPGR